MHPLKPDLQRQLYTDQSNISHIVTKVWWEGNKLKGIVEAAATARGADFDGLIRQGSRVAFSLRAVGPVVEKKGDVTYVKDPLTMYTFDWVVHPSHKVAYMDNVLSESQDIFLPVYSDDNNILSESTIMETIVNNNRNIKLSKNNQQIITESKNIFVDDFINQSVRNYFKGM